MKDQRKKNKIFYFRTLFVGILVKLMKNMFAQHPLYGSPIE